ncbi:MAG: efflux transporter outer membrane subunit [Kiritimatiellia bacterium]
MSYIFKIAAVLSLPLIAFLCGCDSLRPAPRHRALESGVLPEQFSSVAATAEQSNTVVRLSVPDRWWQLFESKELNTLVASAFTNNLDLATAAARLRQARERKIIAGAPGDLQLSGRAGAGVDKSGKTSGGMSVDRTQESYFAGLTAAYELDIWGRISSAERAAELSYAATDQQLSATALLISGEIARSWLQLKVVLLEMALVGDQIATSTQALQLLQVRQRAALSAAVDVYQQASLVAALERLLPQLAEQRDDLHMRLNLLLGAPASAPLPVMVIVEPLPVLASFPECGMPAGLLARRPDVQAAWLKLQAQEWSVASRQAERLPALTLTGTLNFEANEIADVFKNWHLNLAAGLLGPILDGGRRAAEARLAHAVADESFIAYTDVVLRAVQEVEQAIVRERNRREYLDAVENEIELNDKTLSESTNRYRKGLMEYLNVLTALSTKQLSERRRLAARSSVILNRMALYQALAGQWVLKDE